jgi:truncated hemoglobin YjbI
MRELEIYSMIGAEGFTRLVAAFYRQIPQDERVGPLTRRKSSRVRRSDSGVF